MNCRCPYIVFRFRFLYGFMFVYICQDGGTVGFVDCTKLLFALSSTYAAIQSSEKYSRTLLRNTKPAQSLQRTFSRRNSRKKSRSDNNMDASEASVHSVRNRLCYRFSLYQTNESCSQSVSRRLMLLISFNKPCLRVTSSNVTEAERPFYERSQR